MVSATARLRNSIETDLREQLEDLLNIIFILAEDMSFAEMARSASVSYTTVVRLYNGDWKRPQFLTVQKLARSVNLQVGLLRGEVVISEASDVVFAK